MLGKPKSNVFSKISYLLLCWYSCDFLRPNNCTDFWIFYFIFIMQRIAQMIRTMHKTTRKFPTGESTEESLKSVYRTSQ